MKTVYEVTVKTEWSPNAHKCAGFFPTEEMAKNHVASWPGFIVRYLDCQPKEVEDDFQIVPPEHMQMGVAKQFDEWKNGQTEEYVPELNRQAFLPDPWHDFEPAWKNAHDWRKYVTGDLREIWQSFTLGQKLAIAENAQRIADSEEWE